MSVVKAPTLPNALDLAYGLTLAAASPVLCYRLVRTGKWRLDWRGRLGHASPPEPDPRPTVLLHGVSVGEVVSAQPLVEALTAGYGGCRARVVLSATTNTGHARAQALYGAGHIVVRYPMDFRRAVCRFLDVLRPDVVALLELEVWPNFVYECENRGIPVVVVNGRLSSNSFQKYLRVRRAIAPTFRRLAAVVAQTEEYATRFERLGVPSDRIVVADSIKWDVPLRSELGRLADEFAGPFGVDPTKPLVVAVSTGPGEEAALLSGLPEGVQLMVIPRRPERFPEVAQLAPWVRRSTVTGAGGNGRPPVDRGGSLFLVDTVGEADVATALATVAVIGRSWNGMGGSNPVPPALLGRPMVIGPDHRNFSAITRVLCEAGAMRVAAEPWPAILEILGDPSLAASMSRAGPEAVRARAGAVRFHASTILGQLRRFGGPEGNGLAT